MNTLNTTLTPLFIYVDESAFQGERYSRRLEQTGILRVQHRFPERDLQAETLLVSSPAGLIIDYELRAEPGANAPVTYKGGTLATRVREENSAIPIVFLTNGSLFNANLGSASELEAVDYVFFKSEAEEAPEKVAKRLVALADAYDKLSPREHAGSVPALFEVLGAREDEYEKLWDAVPPLERVPGDSRTRWTPGGVCRWILNSLFEYPGILYDAEYAAASLGLSKQSFLSDAVQEILDSTRYSGVLSNFDDRWWTARLHQQAYAEIARAEAEAPLAGGFAAALRKNHGVETEPAKCNDGCGEIADTLCFLSRDPTTRRHSLEYRPDGRVPAFEPARVSYREARTSMQFDSRLVPAIDKERLLALQQEAEE